MHTDVDRRKPRRLAVVARTSLALSVLLGNGCNLIHRIAPNPGPHDTRQSFNDNVGMQVSYPQVTECLSEVSQTAREAMPPLINEDPTQIPTFDLTLAQAVQMAVGQSPVLRDIGGAIVTQPGATPTIYDPSLAHADPIRGVEAALSAFDAQYSSQLFWQKLDQPSNLRRDPIVGLFNPAVFQATTGTHQSELRKRTAQGGTFALRHVTLYERNNRPTREFASDFVGWLEAEWRQPLLRGAGTEYNRIVGAGNFVSQYNGVLIARVNEDVALADFENAVIRLVNDVEQSYWDLSAAYRILEATLRGQESALQIFQQEEARLEAGSGREDQVAQAQSQYYQFKAQVETALSGPQGLYALEQRLRYLLGMPPADGRLVKPITAPSDVPIVFDWESALSQALQRRVEIRRQRFNIKRREMELYAARLNRRPQLDFLGNYRWRGLGDELIGSDNGEPLDNLYGEILGGDYQEWQAGMELTFPVGLRAASNAVAHARLALNRERAVLNETELRISHNLADAVRRMGLTHTLLQTTYNGFLADLHQVEVLQIRWGAGAERLDVVLNAQRQVVNSEINFYQSLADYNLAIRDLHREKGSLLAYNGVSLAEGPWASGASRDAYEMGRFLTTRHHPEAVKTPAPISSGPFDPSAPQSTMPPVVPDAVPQPEWLQAPEVHSQMPEVQSDTAEVPSADPAASAEPAANAAAD